MPGLISVLVTPKVFARLQKLAVPLVDDTSTVIDRLVDHWEGTLTSSEHMTNRAPELWRSSRGDFLPVGAPLQASTRGQTFHASVERGGIRFDGTLYPNLTPAAIAAKEKLGLTGDAASVNGRKFWKIRDSSTQRWIPVADLAASNVNVDALLAELDRL